MTCPVDAEPPAAEPTAVPAASATPPAERGGAEVVERFERVTGSRFLVLFAAALFDQSMLPQVASALQATGRLAQAPWGRALRTEASAQIVTAGEQGDRLAESARLVRLHQRVKGVGPDGIRYSAMQPEAWNWVLLSTFRMQRAAFITLTGARLSATEDQAIWDSYRAKADGLQLPGRARLPHTYAVMCQHYDWMVRERLQATSMLATATSILRRPPRPEFLPAIAEPLWRLVRPLAGHLAAVLGFGVMHPGVRHQVPMTWTSRHDLEFAVLTALLRAAFRWLPTRITDTPLARNRREYRRLIASYRRVGLRSFAPEQAAASQTAHSA